MFYLHNPNNNCTTNIKKSNTLLENKCIFSSVFYVLNIDIPFVGIVGGHNDSWFGDGFKTAVKVFGEDVMYFGKYGPCTMIKNDYGFFSKYLYHTKYPLSVVTAFV